MPVALVHLVEKGLVEMKLYIFTFVWEGGVLIWVGASICNNGGGWGMSQKVPIQGPHVTSISKWVGGYPRKCSAVS